jgi:hypothetical protein
LSDAVEAIGELLVTYGRLLDAADYEGVGELFADGALLDPDGAEMARGRDGVANFYKRRVILYDGSPDTEHVTKDAVIEVDDASTTATARSSFVTHQRIDGRRVRVAAGRYEDRFAVIDGRWAFTHRRFFLDESDEIEKHVRLAR